MTKLAFTSLIVILFAVNWLFLIEDSHGFIFWKGNTTACDTCDGLKTYSGRNVFCCLTFSKCCG